ncbi:hypothetical protein PspLS_06324 [Pyricularia sp. CBS 133598]|nr:hypothetical protein PspLS_06324 [Pyricularia sp. CBS 133598]
MQFSALKVAVTTLAVCSNVVMSQTQALVASPAQIVNELQILTRDTQSLINPAHSLTVMDAGLLPIGQGSYATILTGLTRIVTTATSAQAQWNGLATPEAAEVTSMFNAYRELVRSQQTLLNTLTSKAGIFQTVPFVGQPMAAVLRALEGIFDNMGFTLVAELPTKASDVQSLAASLHLALENAIGAYSGLIPVKKRSLSRRDAFRAALRA